MILKTQDNSLTLVHPQHQESYHSNFGASFETNSLYIEGSQIETFMKSSHSWVNILDVGLGLGYNACASLELAYSHNHKINLLSLENDYNLFQELISGKARWMKNWKQDWKHSRQKFWMIISYLLI